MDYFGQICESIAERSELEPEPSTLSNVLNPHQNSLFALQKQQQCPYLQMHRMNILIRITNSPHNECDGPFGCCFPNKPS
jgi:hypothetical protein